MTTKFTVKVCGPLDNFVGTLSLKQWLKQYSPSERTRQMMQFMRATVAVARHPWWEWGLREAPMVAYNVEDACEYFIFKIDNNGTTFLVGESVPSVAMNDNYNDTIEVEL